MNVTTDTPPANARPTASTAAGEGVGPRAPFPAVPTGWYYLCRSRDLRPGPVRVEVGDKLFVAFRDASGRPSTLDGRCSHMRADLSRGEVAAERLRCPLHAWEYDVDGRCVHIPATHDIPGFARQTAYPTAEIGGNVVFCNAPVAPFPVPFYEGRAPEELLAAEPFDMVARIPWYMVAANAFDLQHFRVAHDRTLAGTPVIDTPAPFARRISAEYEVTGTGLRDRLTRRFSGPRVRMSVTVWGGTSVLVTARFRRTTSYGMVFVRPIDHATSHLRTVVWVPRRRGAAARALVDPLDAAVRRRFIRAFMNDDAVRAHGVGYNPATLIDADRELRDYFAWLADVAGGK